LADAISAVRLCRDEWMAQLGIEHLGENIHALPEELYRKLVQELLSQGQNVGLEFGVLG
jgi:hypothetical protein